MTRLFEIQRVSVDPVYYRVETEWIAPEQSGCDPHVEASFLSNVT